MRKYEEFHGETILTDIGKRLREIAKKEKQSFKIITGHGSLSGTSKSKQSALKSLEKMKNEGLIEGYFPGDALKDVLTDASPYYESKLRFGAEVKNDPDRGNPGTIFVFVTSSRKE